MMSEEPQSSGSEAVTSVVGRLLQHIVALLEARVDLTRQEMRASLRDVAIALFLLIAALAVGDPSAVAPPHRRCLDGAGGAPARGAGVGPRRAGRAAGGGVVGAAAPTPCRVGGRCIIESRGDACPMSDGRN